MGDIVVYKCIVFSVLGGLVVPSFSPWVGRTATYLLSSLLLDLCCFCCCWKFSWAERLINNIQLKNTAALLLFVLVLTVRSLFMLCFTAVWALARICAGFLCPGLSACLLRPIAILHCDKACVWTSLGYNSCPAASLWALLRTEFLTLWPCLYAEIGGNGGVLEE